MRCGAPEFRAPAWRCTTSSSELPDRDALLVWYIPRVIKSPGELQAFEDSDCRMISQSRTYYEALDIFLALWEEARLLNPSVETNWLEDVQCDIRVAQTLNARPRTD